MQLFIKTAFRYLFSKKQISAINVISSLSMAGITLGVAALIIVMGIFNGFNELAEKQLSTFDPHIRISDKNQNYFKISKKLLNKIKKYKHYSSYEKVIISKVLAVSSSGTQVFNLYSFSNINSKYYSEIFKQYIVKDETNSDSINDIYLGYKIADVLDKMPGEHLNLTSPKILDKSLLSFRPLKNINLRINGLIYSNIKNYDAEIGFSSEKNVRKLELVPENCYSYLDIRLSDKKYSNEFKNYLKSSLNKNFIINDWKDLNKRLLQIMQFERIATFLILGIIILIAVFNILTSLTMTVLEKQKEIGLLRALGTEKSSIRKLFLTEGLIIGLISTTIGVIIGLMFYFIQINYPFLKLDSNKYIIDALPIKITFFQVFIISFFTIILSVCSAIIPAKKAEKIKIIDSLREE